MQTEDASPFDRADAGAVSRPDVLGDARSHGAYVLEAFNPDGTLKWREVIPANLVVDEGLDYLLDAGIAGGTQISTWYLGLTDGSPTAAAGDTMGSHAGWAEVTDYSEGARQTFSAGAVSGQSVDNSASKASFSINASVTIGGAFLASNSTKGGSSGTLYSIGAFSSGDRSLADGDTLEVTATFTQSAA